MICLVVLIPTGLIAFIYDVFIWNPGHFSDSTLKFFDVVVIIGAIAIGVFILTCAIEQVILRIKFKKLLKNK